LASLQEHLFQRLKIEWLVQKVVDRVVVVVVVVVVPLTEA
jgi:hypothetical protein